MTATTIKMNIPQSMFCASWGEAVTPNDAQDLPEGPCSAIYVGGAGVVSVVHPNGKQTDYPAVAGGYILAHVARVRATGTTATGIRAMYGG